MNSALVIPFSAFEKLRAQVVWHPLVTKEPGRQAERHELAYVGYIKTQYGLSEGPYFVLQFKFDKASNSIEIVLLANINKDRKLSKTVRIELQRIELMKSVLCDTLAFITGRYKFNRQELHNQLGKFFKDRIQYIDKAFADFIEEDIDIEIDIEKDNDFLAAQKYGLEKQSDYGSWYSQSLPEPEAWQNYIGTSAVDVSQIASTVGGNAVNKAVEMVNDFQPDLLRNIAVIFDFSNMGAYGVYVPELDAAIKNEKIKSMLERDGLNVEDVSENQFTAYSPDVDPEEVQSRINAYQNEIRGSGGSIFGINMYRTYQSALDDMQKGNLEQNDMEDLLTLHIGATMVHEAVHAGGATSEGPSEQSEMQFMDWAVDRINQGRQKDQEPLLQVTPRSAVSTGWYREAISKKAQYGAQFSIQQRDLFPGGLSGSFPPWAALFWDLEATHIESMLGVHRQNDNKPNTIEKRLRLRDANRIPDGIKKDEHLEDALEKDRNEYEAYKHTEELIEERRTTPLAFTVREASNKDSMVKVATFFGWMNNLDLPMRERVDEYDEGTGWLAFDWDYIRKQFRYNPEYDDKGFGFRWLEPRYLPELWDRMIAKRPSSFINPAQRFGESNSEDVQIAQKDMMLLVGTLEYAANLIKQKRIHGTRFLLSHDLVDDVIHYCGAFDELRAQPMIPVGTKLIPVWLVNMSIPEDQVMNAERYVNGQDEFEDIFDYLCGYSSIKKEVIETIIDKAKDLCVQYGIDDLFLVGGFPRALVMNESWKNIRDLDFSSAWPDQCLKLGELLAEKLGAENVKLYHRTLTLSWEWMGVKCDFRGKIHGYGHEHTRRLLRENGIKTTPLNLDIYSRDLTINMLVYNISDGKVYDVTKESVEDIEMEVVRTIFTPAEVVQLSPLTILRAIKYALRYDFDIELHLSEAMKEHVGLLFNGKYCDERLRAGLDDILKESKVDGKQMIEYYGLEKLYELIEKD